MKMLQRHFAMKGLLCVCFLLFLGDAGGPANAQAPPATDRVGVAVLVDVSGSMRFSDENWISEVRTSVNKFITGGTLNENVWRVDGEADDAFVKQVRNGNPIYVPPRPLLLAEVGEIQRSYPYLRTVQLRTPQTLNDASTFLQRAFPKLFNDDWTYLDIGHAIVRDRMLEQGALQWYVIQISDEDQDYSNVSNTPESARRLANGYAANLLSEEPLSLAYREDTRLRMKLFRYTSKVDPCEANANRPLCDSVSGPSDETKSRATSQQVQLRMPGDEETVEGEVVEFRWTATSGLNQFDIEIRGENGDLLKRKRTRQKRHRTSADSLDDGSYTWKVVGYGESERVTSSEQSFTVSGGGGGTLWWVLALLALGAGGAYAYNVYKRSQRRSA